jgi:hypothetical protein
MCHDRSAPCTVSGRREDGLEIACRAFSDVRDFSGTL